MIFHRRFRHGIGLKCRCNPLVSSPHSSQKRRHHPSCKTVRHRTESRRRAQFECRNYLGLQTYHTWRHCIGPRMRNNRPVYPLGIVLRRNCVQGCMDCPRCNLRNSGIHYRNLCPRCKHRFADKGSRSRCNLSARYKPLVHYKRDRHPRRVSCWPDGHTCPNCMSRPCTRCRHCNPIRSGIGRRRCSPHRNEVRKARRRLCKSPRRSHRGTCRIGHPRTVFRWAGVVPHRGWSIH